jgi:HD-like signal output (HDOD) protein
LKYADHEEAYVVGLMHDIGKLLLDQFVLEDYQKIVDYVKSTHLPVWQVEEKLIGIDHANLGGMMAARWNFPTPLIEGIRYHHAPSLARTNQKLPAIINLANVLATQCDDLSNELFSHDLHPDTLKILNIQVNDMNRLTTGVNEALNVGMAE